MTIEHLKQLRNALEINHWRIDEELSGNEHDISGYWKISRPNGDTRLTIEFEGMDALKVLPIEEAYGCRVSEVPDVTAYFSRANRSWPSELKGFVSQLNKVGY